jgi:hypothetical protein
MCTCIICIVTIAGWLTLCNAAMLYISVLMTTAQATVHMLTFINDNKTTSTSNINLKYHIMIRTQCVPYLVQVQPTTGFGSFPLRSVQASYLTGGPSICFALPPGRLGGGPLSTPVTYTHHTSFELQLKPGYAALACMKFAVGGLCMLVTTHC